MSQDAVRPKLPYEPRPPIFPPSTFESDLAAAKLSLAPEQIEAMAVFLGHLVGANEAMNLTRITDPAEAWSRHILDALTLLPHLTHLEEGARLIDIGSGGGVPGIPLAIARPDLAITLVEATQKKAAFLRDVSALLGLRVGVVADRAEALAKTGHARSYDVATARAVAKIAELVPLTAPLVKPLGQMLFIKGARASDELAEAAHVLKRFHCQHLETTTTKTGRIVVIRRAS